MRKKRVQDKLEIREWPKPETEAKESLESSAHKHAYILSRCNPITRRGQKREIQRESEREDERKRKEW